MRSEGQAKSAVSEIVLRAFEHRAAKHALRHDALARHGEAACGERVE